MAAGVVSIHYRGEGRRGPAHRGSSAWARNNKKGAATPRKTASEWTTDGRTDALVALHVAGTVVRDLAAQQLERARRVGEELQRNAGLSRRQAKNKSKPKQERAPHTPACCDVHSGVRTRVLVCV